MATRTEKSERVAGLREKLQQVKQREARRSGRPRSKSNGEDEAPPTPAKRRGAAPVKEKKPDPPKRPKLPEGATDLSIPREVKVVRGIAELVSDKKREKDGLTKFQRAIVQLIKDFGPLHIKNILRMIWSDPEVRQFAAQTPESFDCMRVVRNAVRAPVKAGMITRVDNRGTYAFVKWV